MPRENEMGWQEKTFLQPAGETKLPRGQGPGSDFEKKAAITKMKNGKQDFVGRMRVNANPITEL